MIDKFQEFLNLCFCDVPTSVLVGLLLVFFLGTVLFLSFLGFKKGMIWSARLLFFEYLFFLLLLSVLTRTVQEDRIFLVTPFWSYRAILEGKDMLPETIMNVIAFIPIGFLLAFAFRRLRWWQVLSIGAGFSLLIEVLQFVFKRGFAEFDDVFHNVLGCAIGLGVYWAVARVIKRVAKERC